MSSPPQPARQSDLLAQALLREYMHRRGFLQTLKTFDEESPRDANTISSRNAMAQLMSWADVGPRIAVDQKPPLPFMVQLCHYRLRKRGIIVHKNSKGASSVETKELDSSDEERETQLRLEQEQAQLDALKAELRAAEDEFKELELKEQELKHLEQQIQKEAQEQQDRAKKSSTKKDKSSSSKSDKKDKVVKRSNQDAASAPPPVASAAAGPSSAASVAPASRPSTAIGGGGGAKVFDPLGLTSPATMSSASSLPISSNSGLARNAKWTPGMSSGGDDATNNNNEEEDDFAIRYDTLAVPASARAIALAAPVDHAAVQRRQHQELAEHGGLGSASPGRHFSARSAKLSDVNDSSSSNHHAGGLGLAVPAGIAPLSAVQVSTSKRNRKEARDLAILTADHAPNTGAGGDSSSSSSSATAGSRSSHVVIQDAPPSATAHSSQQQRQQSPDSPPGGRRRAVSFQ